jgi:hypothetical protein
MAGTAEGVWLDTESIHPIVRTRTTGETGFNCRGRE